MTTPGLVYGYIRVSTEQQAATGTSMEAQEEAIRNYFEFKLKPMGYKFGGWYRDPAKSGTTPIRSRPGGFLMSNQLESGDAVVFAKLDRGFRNLKDMIETLDLWQERGVGVHVLDISVDTSSDIGKLIVRIIAAVAEFERGLIWERIQSGKARKREKGYIVDGFSIMSPPYGFKIVGRPHYRRFAKDPAQRAVGNRFIQLFDSGMTADQIRLLLIKERFRWRDKQLGISSICRWTAKERILQAQEAAEAAALVDPKPHKEDNSPTNLPTSQGTDPCPTSDTPPATSP